MVSILKPLHTLFIGGWRVGGWSTGQDVSTGLLRARARVELVQNYGTVLASSNTMIL